MVSGSSFSWSSNITVAGVVAKGGPNANFYDYRPAGTTSDTNLTAPINPSNGRPYGLSHVSFCHVPQPSTELTVSSSHDQVIAGTQVTLTFREHNDGEVVLSNAAVTTDNAACNAGLTGPTGDTTPNGILDPSETWVWTCQITINDTTTVVAIASGVAPTGHTVTWCADPSNPPARTICDQDERASVSVDILVLLEGCSPGYWKNHPAAWPATGYSPGQTVGSVFAGAGSLSGDTLIEALHYRGGRGTSGAMRILLRQAVAAVLNAAHPDVAYPASTDRVINAVNDALASGDRRTMLALKDALDTANNLGCPLN